MQSKKLAWAILFLAMQVNLTSLKVYGLLALFNFIIQLSILIVILHAEYFFSDCKLIGLYLFLTLFWFHNFIVWRSTVQVFIWLVYYTPLKWCHNHNDLHHYQAKSSVAICLPLYPFQTIPLTKQISKSSLSVTFLNNSIFFPRPPKGKNTFDHFIWLP